MSDRIHGLLEAATECLQEIWCEVGITFAAHRLALHAQRVQGMSAVVATRW